jgi:hypothetical protein
VNNKYGNISTSTRFHTIYCIKKDSPVSAVSPVPGQLQKEKTYGQDAGGGKIPNRRNAGCIDGKSCEIDCPNLKEVSIYLL